MRCFDLDGAVRYSDRAVLYARARPSYPADAIAFVLHGAGPRIIDVGAGPATSTKLLGERAIGCDPNLPMLLAAARPRLLLARAESLPFRTASADLLTVFNAFHWFQPGAFFAEAHRVLPPAARLALIWNDWNHGDAFTREFVRLMRSAAGDFPPEDRDAEVAPLYATRLFTNIERRSFPNEHRLDHDLLRMRLQSMSYIPLAGPAWDALDRELAVLFARYAREGFVTHHYTTEVFVARRAK